MTTTYQIASLTEAGIDCHDVHLGKRHIGIVLAASTNAVRVCFDYSGQRTSARRFPDAQQAVAYLIARREKLIAKRARA